MLYISVYPLHLMFSLQWLEPQYTVCAGTGLVHPGLHGLIRNVPWLSWRSGETPQNVKLLSEEKGISHPLTAECGLHVQLDVALWMCEWFWHELFALRQHCVRFTSSAKSRSWWRCSCQQQKTCSARKIMVRAALWNLSHRSHFIFIKNGQTVTFLWYIP